MLISVTGFIGSGKDTVADYLVANYNFKRESFASSLKDAIATIFTWDRELLEGKTEEGRNWRDTVDPWWSQRLGIPNLTPRWVLQYWGTEVCRQGFNDDIWIASLENKLKRTNENIIISDCRFPNEFKMIKKLDGHTLCIQRDDLPIWYEDALLANEGITYHVEKLKSLNIHPSETAWIGLKFDDTIINNKTKRELYSIIDDIILKIRN